MLNITDSNIINYHTNASPQRSISETSRAAVEQSGVRKDSFSGDLVSFSYFNIQESITYNSSGVVDTKADAAYDLLRSYVLNVFEKQNMSFTLSVDDRKIDMEGLSQQEADTLIADDGYFGVEHTSERIVDFAIGIAGDDPTRLEAILQGVENGFNKALEAFGGWLPDISHKTYETTVNKLNAWAESAQTA